MAAAAGMSWASLDNQIRAAKAPSAPSALPSVVAPLKQSPTNPVGATNAEERSKALLSDWTRVLDTINEAGTQAQDRERRLAAQASAHERQVSELRAEINQLRDQARVNEARTQALLSAAEHRAKNAEERAEHAEAWLARIGSAVETILLKP